MKVERNGSKVQPVGRGGSDSRRIDFFNPEEYISSKREWTMMRKETAKQYESCDAMKVVDYFCVVGMESQESFISGKVEDRTAFCTNKNDLEHSEESKHTSNTEEKVVREAEKSQATGSSIKNAAGQPQATSEPKPVVLYSYPESLPSDLEQEIPSYCFPLGVTKDIVGRTASLGGIHEIVYGQHYQFQSNHSFVFMLQTTSQDDPSPQTLYGICCYKKELAHRVPALVASSSQARSQTASCKAELEVPDAPMFPRVTNRCYCLLSRVPLFASHFELLNRIISFERNYHINEFVRQVDKGVWKTPEGLALEHAARAPSILGQGRPLTGGSASSSECDNAVAVSAATGAGKNDIEYDNDEAMLLDEGDFGTPEENSSMDLLTPSAPLLTGATPYFTPAGATNDLPGSKPASRTMSRIHSEGLADRGADALPAANNAESVKNLERQLQSITFRDEKEIDCIPEETSGTTLQHQYSESPSVELGSWINPGQSSERSGSEETSHVDEEVSSSNKLLHAGWEHPEQMLDTYIQSRHVGDVWSKIQREIHISDSVQLKDISGESLTKVPCSMSQSDFLAAQEVQGWSICALCRLLDIENIITLLTAILLERQTVIFCPNIGLLSALVLSVQPLLAPFAWHSLMIPVLPETSDKLDLLDAPVPFIFGILSKTRDIRSRCSNLVRVSAYKDSIKFSGGLPRLPGATQLALSLYETHSAIRQLGVYERSDCRPVYQISEEEAMQAKVFAEGIRHHLMSLTADMAGYMITDVSTSSDSHRCSILLKESFVESFDQRDREFMREFVETQMFTSYCDLF